MNYHEIPLDDFSEIQDVESQINEKTQGESLEFLNGLRGIAALMVYNSHWVAYWYEGDNPLFFGLGYEDKPWSFAALPIVRLFWTGGAAAVAIFFVLSGFVLSKSHLQTMVRDGQASGKKVRRKLLGASIRRPIRLFLPPLAFSLMLVLTMHLPFGLSPHIDWPEPLDSLPQELIKWIKECAIVFYPFIDSGPFGRWFCYNPPVWTIAVEFVGSIVVFLALALVSFVRSRYRLGIFLIMTAIFTATYQWALAMFIAGIILALNELSPTLPETFNSKTTSLINHTLLILAWYLLSQPTSGRIPSQSSNTPGWYYNDEYWRFWEIPGSALAVYTLLRIPWLQRLFETRPLRFLGRVSFSFYLTHIPLLWTAGDRISRVLGQPREHAMWWDGILAIPDVGPTGLTSRFLVVQAIVLPVNLFLAELGTRWIDQPSVKLGKWVVKKLV
ncbi:hypothetical protein K470DRAFT_301470 [Piedraia hortae CBS 480.64]|uniref:Acyltransferase 3 domain-containing protein n=1 Tax=Piedraia hortae CBS 480.64 TaxID=1314780 RepID=A0A6A7BQS1_9PEZI|nr:hypothetical protein K470DRAFT_301470 [Piedraia hortae CBS 480.64]